MIEINISSKTYPPGQNQVALTVLKNISFSVKPGEFCCIVGPSRQPATLAVGITNPYVRHPAVAVASMATIAELSDGRAVLGVGAGGAMSLAPFGLAALTPVSAVERFLQIAEASREGLSVDGYTPSDIAVAAVAPRVPTFVGGRGPRLNRLASTSADGAFVAGMPPFRYDEVIGLARSARSNDIA
jgi:5,10-methylenetetrahydromethanopterin reductase